MNLPEDRLNEQLEHPNRESRLAPTDFLSPSSASAQPPTVDDLFLLARQLQHDPQVQIAPAFVPQLERRILRRQAELRLRQKRPWFPVLVFWRAHRIQSSLLAACLLICLCSTGLFTLAAQASSPSNPLYGLKRWEQHVQYQFSGPEGQVTLHLQLAQDDLHLLASLSNATHVQAYTQTLQDLDQQLQEVNEAIGQVPAGTSHTRLVDELARFKEEVRQTLRRLLPALTFQERLATTSELARVGDRVPLLTSATLLLPAHPHEDATISLQGQNLVAGAQLLIDEHPVNGTGTLRHGTLSFEVMWNGDQHPHSLSILDPDGTAAQITGIAIIQSNPDGKGNSNANGTGSTNGNGNKPASTPTPNGNKPSGTPTPHH